MPLEGLAGAAIHHNNYAEIPVRRLPRRLPDRMIGEHSGEQDRVHAGGSQRVRNLRAGEGAVGRAREHRLAARPAPLPGGSRARGSPTGSGSSLTRIWRDMSLRSGLALQSTVCMTAMARERQAETSFAMFASAASACR